MYTRTSAAAALALAALLALPAVGVAQEAEQDTTPQYRGMMRQMGRQGRMGMRGARLGLRHMRAAARMGAAHVGPHFLIGLKDDLELTEEQVTQLEGVHTSHYALMTGMREQMQEQATALAEARKANDYDAMESAIDELARLRTAQAKSFINVERQTLGILTDSQRQKFETWKEGAQLFRRQGLQQMRMHRDGDAPGMRMRHRVHQEEGGGAR